MKTHIKTTRKEVFQTVDDTTRATRLETVPLRPTGGQKDKHKAPHCDVGIAGMAPVLTHERIAERARAIWVERGCLCNEDDRNWHEAEAQLRRERGLVRTVIRDAGYNEPVFGFDVERCRIQTLLRRQSPDIEAAVVHNDGNLGAGDQGVMFGYAANETEQFMPLPIALAHRLLIRRAALRKSGALPWLGPDAKSQVTVRYEGICPVSVDTVVLSTQHRPDITNEQIRHEVEEQIITPVIPEPFSGRKVQCLVNPSGRFVIGGPAADTGLTGRKNVVDCYGGSCPHGGGSFSGKDPTKVDRSGAYAARYIAKNIVAAGLAQRCTVQIAYAIGCCDPVSLSLDLYETGEVDAARLLTVVRELFPLTPKQIIQSLDLLRPIYRETSVYGHFGHDEPSFTWERLDRVEILRSAF